MANYNVSQTDNLNFLSSVSFRFNLDKAPKVTFNCQAGPLPGVSFDEIPMYSPKGTVPFKLPALNWSFDDLELRFIVDEKMENWKEIFDWMKSTQAVEDYSPVVKLTEQMTDGSLLILDSTMTPIKRILFKNIFPKSLSGLEFDSADVDAQTITATVVFSFQSYEVSDSI
tara:strand:+ start:967 stop:1476 length:510 start_codon:yes stop_codon:yes gene_type:complete